MEQGTLTIRGHGNGGNGDGSKSNGGAPAEKETGFSRAAARAPAAPAAGPSVVAEAAAVRASAWTGPNLARRARLLGYEGDPCSECGQFTLLRNGTCLKCNTCGATTGCS